MKNHEKLNEICEKIGFNLIENNFAYINISKEIIHIYDKDNKNQWPTLWRMINVTELIFTTEFNNKIVDYLEKNLNTETKLTYVFYIMNNLNDPVEFLYNLIK